MSQRSKSSGAGAVFIAALVSTGMLLASPADQPSAEALIKDGHWKRARAAVTPQYQVHPNDAELNFLMSEIEDAFGDLDDARAHAEKAVALRGHESRYHRQLADVDGETAETASFFAKSGWAKKFKSEAETAATLDPKNLDARFDLLEYDLQAPRLMGGGKDKAGAMAEEIARIDPAQGDLAQARLAGDRKDAAGEESWYLKALAAKPRDYEILIDLGSFYVSSSQAKLDQAEKYARAAVQTDPTRAAGYTILAAALATEGRWSDLTATLAQAEKSVPDDLTPYYQAGRSILVRSALDPGASGGEDLKRAEGYFRKYLSAEPEGGEPDLGHAHWRLGQVLEKEGRKADAVSELKTALRLKPDLAEAKKDLQRLQ